MSKQNFQSSKLFNLNYTYPKGKNLTVNRGGSSSGKTYTIMTVILVKCINEPGITVTVVGQDIPNLKKGAIRDTELILSNLPMLAQWVRQYNISDRIYTFKNASKIEFTSYDNEQDAKNGKRDYLFCNEVNGITEQIFEALYIRTKRHTWVDFNPSAEFWLSTKKYEQRETSRTIISTFRNNPFLDDNVRDKILAYEPTKENIAKGTADEYRWKVYGKGEYAPLEGAILKRWKKGKFNDELAYTFGLDWGWTDPFTLTKVAVDKKKKIIYVKQIAYSSGLSMTNIKTIIENNCTRQDLIICDSSEPLNIAELRMYNGGYNTIRAFKRPGIVQERLRWMQDYLIIVDDSPDIENELNNYIWNDKRAEIPIDKFNHSIDGFGYAFTYWHLKNR